MYSACGVIAVCALLAGQVFGQPPRHSRHFETIDYPPLPEAIAEIGKQNAQSAAASAKDAADVALKVAEHVSNVTAHTQDALRAANAALRNARVNSNHIMVNESEAYFRVEDEAVAINESANLSAANNSADALAGNISANLSAVNDSVHDVAANISANLSAVNESVDVPVSVFLQREQPASTGGAAASTAGVQPHGASHVGLVEDGVAGPSPAPSIAPAVPATPPGADVDMDMPYGDLEPFGREDTAQELTEASIRESDAMVDQLERAEVAEEKRAVFRALTRLRGAAITSFDGVARAQTGNIDEYSKVNKWRASHQMKHLANEEADVSKWAFPDNADF